MTWAPCPHGVRTRGKKLKLCQLLTQGTALRSNRQILPSFCCVPFLQVQGTTSCSTRRMRVFRRPGPRLCGMKGNRGCSWSLDQVLRHDMSTKWLLIPMSTKWYEYQDRDDWEEDEEQLPVSAAMKGGDRCRQCGKAGHFAKNCSTDMSKVRCLRQWAHRCELQEIAERERQAESQDLPEVQGES